jgi:hypothetical protein
MRFVRKLIAAMLLTTVTGCCCQSGKPGGVNRTGVATTKPTVAGLRPLYPLPQARALVDPPTGWRVDKFDVDSQHTHVTWVSPSGDTAYGVVMMNLPLPVGPDLVLWAFLNKMKAADHRGDLLSKENAPDLPGLRFVAESGLYRIRTNLIVHGWHAWAVYAGTLVARHENIDELLTAEKARDRTEVDIAPPETANAK